MCEVIKLVDALVHRNTKYIWYANPGPKEEPKLRIGCNKLLVVVGQIMNLCEVVQIYLLQYPSCNILNMVKRKSRPRTNDYQQCRKRTAFGSENYSGTKVPWMVIPVWVRVP